MEDSVSEHVRNAKCHQQQAGQVFQCSLWIVIPGSRIPGLANPNSRDFGIEKNVLFSWKQHIFHDICYKLEKNDFFSHTLTVTHISPPATVLQGATAFFHSWLIRPIATCLFDSTGKWGSCLETAYSYLLTVPPTSVEAERAFSVAGIFTNKQRSRLSDNSVDTLCFLRSFCLRAKPKCN